MKVEYVNPFIASTIETFNTMLGMQLQTGKPLLKEEPFPTYDVSGIIGLSGDARGSILISFPKTVALKAVSRFMGVDVKIIGPDLSDAIGEIVNIIAGAAKKDLVNLNVSISLPKVVIGKNHKIAPPPNTKGIVVVFNCEIGKLALEVNIKTV